MSRTIVIVYASRLQRIGLTCPGAAAVVLRADTETELAAMWAEYRRPVVLIDQTTGQVLASWHGPSHAQNWVMDPNESGTVISFDRRRARTTRPDIGEFREIRAAAREDLP